MLVPVPGAMMMTGGGGGGGLLPAKQQQQQMPQPLIPQQHYLLLVRLPAPALIQQQRYPFRIDQLVIAELRNQIVSLKAQQRDQIEQLKHELGEKFRNDMAVLLAEKETQFQKQLEEKEAAWGTELSTRLEEERAEFARRLAERDAEVEATRTEERRSWQAQMDDLLKKANHLLADKERLEKNIRHEVDARVQATVQRYNELQKETMSLQAVFDLRCQEIKSLRQELEKASVAAAEAPVLRERNLSLSNHVEGLEAQLELKNQEERRLHAELAKLKVHCKEESARARLLSMEKEQLQYRLQQRSESDRMSPTKSNHSTPLLSSTTETPRLSRKALPRINLSPIIAENGRNEKAERDSNSCKSRSDGSNASGSDVDEVFTAAAGAAAPSSPTVRDFTEKNDSVSYVLDIGDHSPTAGPSSPWTARRNKLVRSASLRYPARHLH